jgi:hypothetical protein
VRHLLQRKDALLSLRADRRAAVDGLCRATNGKKHALTKLERRELRDVRLQLKALGVGGQEAAAAGGRPGAVSIGLATLDQLVRDDDASAGDGDEEEDDDPWAPDVAGAVRAVAGGAAVAGGGFDPAAGRQSMGLAEALGCLTPAELLVHECLRAAGVDLAI